MLNGTSKSRGNRGASLVETMVSIGVLAVVAPLALAALITAGDGGKSARAETRAPVIVESCLAEIRTARDGFSEHLPALPPGQAFGTGGVVCLGFGGDGTLLGPVNQSGYDNGAPKIGAKDVVFLATMEGEMDTSRTGFPPMLKVKVSIEHPAVARADKRKRMDFHTKLP